MGKSAAKRKVEPPSSHQSTNEDDGQFSGASKMAPGVAGSTDDDSDSSSSSESDIDLDSESMTSLMALEAALESNPNLYDKHIEYIALLRRCRLREKLRGAHRTFAQHFPLSEQLWLACINDELGQVKTRQDIERVQEVFQLAVQDYLSVTLWEAYLRFVAEFDPEVTAHTAAGAAKFRGLCESSLTAAGLHVTEGGVLWAIYRDYELAVLATKTGRDKQEERVRSLFHRQLQVPLADGPHTLAAYEGWEASIGKVVPPAIKAGYEKAQAAVSLRQPYEAAIAPGKAADANLLAAYVAYIKLEQAQDIPARVQCLYERAVAVFPVTVELWVQYGRFLESRLQIPSVTNAVYARATRNCTWAGALWARAMRALEHGVAAAGVPEKHGALFKQALEAGLQGPEDYLEVLMARLDALRHALRGAAEPAGASVAAGQVPSASDPAVDKLRATFREATELMASYFPEHLDRTLRLPGYWARTEAWVLQDDVAARAVWEATLKTGLGRYYEPWAAYVLLERSRRHIKEARAVYKRAAGRKLEEGGSALLSAEWLVFEREEGSAEDLFQTSVKVEPVLEEAAAAAAAVADAQTAATAKAAARQAPKLSREEVARLRQEADPNYKKKGKKEKAKPALLTPAAVTAGTAAISGAIPGNEAAGTSGKRDRAEGGDIDVVIKRARTQAAEAAGAETTAAATSAPAGRSVPNDVAMDEDAPAPSQAGTGDTLAAGTRDTEMTSTVSRYTDEHTIFVKGLRMGVADAEVMSFFSTCRDLRSVRVVREAETNRSRGFAYVEFNSDEGLQEAMQLNGTSFQNKPLVIMKSQPPASSGSGRGGGRFGGRDGGSGRHGGGRDGGAAATATRFGSGSRDTGRGRGRNTGRGRGGQGFHGTHHGSMDGSGRGAGGRGPRLQLDTGAPTQFVPRSVAAKQVGVNEAEAPQSQPMSNDEFRKMLFAKK